LSLENKTLATKKEDKQSSDFGHYIVVPTRSANGQPNVAIFQEDGHHSKNVDLSNINDSCIGVATSALQTGECP
jgi:hypothetical protein